MKYFLVNTFLFLFFLSFQAQFKFDINDSIPVKIGTNTLSLAWSGGLNYVQFSEIDYDFDGDLDLFIFDRSSDNIRLFENKVENSVRTYVMVQQAESYFPENLKYRVALLDYNSDGKNDLFCYGVGGTKVYKNIGNQTLGLQWEIAAELLLSDYNGDYSNLSISSADIPAYTDVDHDSDIDILTFNMAGETVEYHKNMSMELYGIPDSLVYVLKNECWGKFREDQISFSLVLNDQNTPCVGGSIDNPEYPKPTHFQTEKNDSLPLLRHTGSTLLALDVDNSGVLDLILGDVSSGNLILLINGGLAPNTDSQMMSADLNFPGNSIPVSLSVFPAAYFLDVDFDGVKDLVVGANAKNSSQNVTGIPFYKNLGTNELPNFVFQTKSFLQEEMIDVGTGSIPLFFDQNGDGLEDFFIANFFRHKEPSSKESNISNYRNTGSLSTPEFMFVESNFLNLVNQAYGLRTVPTFGDIDSDGDEDLMLGIENGTLVYYENTAGSGNPAVFSSPVSPYKDEQNAVISAGAYAFPQLFDVNKDGLIDLVIGKKTGEISYYQNIGTATSPLFQLVDNAMGNIDIAPITPDGYAAPHFFRWNDTTYLLLGGSDGKLRFYKGIDEHLEANDTFLLETDFFREISVEAYSSCWVNDLDHDGNLDLYVGGDLGGIFRYENDDNSTLGLPEKIDKKSVRVYPNPFKEELKINLEQEVDFEFYDLMGQIQYRGRSSKSVINTSQMKNGFYYLKIYADGLTFVYKVIRH